MTTRRALGALLALLGVAVAAGLGMAATTPTVGEDSPGWDCRTMGNLTCGVTDPDTGERYAVMFDDGQPVEVGPIGH